MLVQAFPHLTLNVMQRVADGKDDAFVEELVVAAGLHDVSQEEVKGRYEHIIGTIMFGGNLPDDIGQLDLVKQGQRDINLVWEAMSELYPQFTRMISLYQADLGQPYSNGTVLYWLLTDMVVVAMHKVKHFMGDKGYLCYVGPADTTRLSCGFYGDNNLIPNAQLSGNQLDDLIPELEGVIYGGMNHFTSTSTGLRVTLIRRQMTKYCAGGDDWNDEDDDPSLYDTTMGARPTLARCVRSFPSLM